VLTVRGAGAWSLDALYRTRNFAGAPA